MSSSNCLAGFRHFSANLATNYFLKKDGKFLNSKLDKKIWLLWSEGRVHGEYDAIETPIGFIPKYDDLKALFKQVFDKDYTEAEYTEQFSIRVPMWLEKMDRIEQIYSLEEEVPKVFLDHLEQQRTRLKEAKEKYGKEDIAPADFI